MDCISHQCKFIHELTILNNNLLDHILINLTENSSILALIFELFIDI